jgi:hypothetical protein
MFESRQSEKFSPLHVVEPDSEINLASFPVGTGDSLSGVSQPELEDNVDLYIPSPIRQRVVEHS